MKIREQKHLSYIEIGKVRFVVEKAKAKDIKENFNKRKDFTVLSISNKTIEFKKNNIKQVYEIRDTFKGESVELSL